MIGQLGDIAEQVGRRAADRRQENLQVGPRHQLGEHAGGLFEQLPAQVVFGGGEALGQSRQIPDRIDRNLDHGHAAVLVYDVAVMLQPAGCDGRLQFGKIEARAGDGDAWADVDAFGDLGREILGDQMAPRIERNDALRIAPLRKRADGCGGMGVGEVRTPDRIERAGRNGQRAVDRIGAAMGADHVAVRRARHRSDDRSALARAGGAPVDGELVLAARRGMRGKADMVDPIGARHVFIWQR